jgi:hypothetical protein
MRADMKKVLTERPRAHGIYSYNDFRQRENAGDYDDLPSHQGMRRPYGWERKEFSDLLGPLQRFLRRSVGRPWDDVWSEICQAVGSGNTVDQHLRGHVEQEVETNTVVVDGKVMSYGRFGYGALGTPWHLYVDPRDGLIYAAPDRPSWKYKYETVEGLKYCPGVDGLLYPPDWGRFTDNAFPRYYRGRRDNAAGYPLKVIGDRYAMLIDGIWYWIEMAETPPAQDVGYVQDGVAKTRRVFSSRYDFVRGEDVKEGRYHAGKRQMCSRDLRRHGLRNIKT